MRGETRILVAEMVPVHLAERPVPNDQLAVRDNSQLLAAWSGEMDARHTAMLSEIATVNARVAGLDSSVIETGTGLAAEEALGAKRHDALVEENLVMRARITTAGDMALDTAATAAKTPTAIT